MRISSLSSFMAFGLLALSSLVPSPAAAQSIWRDNFNAPALNPAWAFVDGTSAGWSLTERPGYLRLYTSTNRVVDENVLLRAPARGNFIIETHLTFLPQADFDFAGLIVYQDARNYFQLGRAYCDSPGACAGSGFYFDKVLGGAFTGSNHAMPSLETQAYLRLELKGRHLTAFLSADGRHWQRFATHELPPRFQIQGVGLTASDHYSSTPVLPADFDYFLFQGVPVQPRRGDLR